MMPMQIGAVRNATKPSSRAKAFSIENLAADRLGEYRITQGTSSSALGTGRGGRLLHAQGKNKVAQFIRSYM